eukprot:COSAG02_NODE_1647_length_11517_cov_2.751533_5_plen_71_part_00
MAPVGLGGGANRRWAVAPIGAGRHQSALGGGANRCWAVAPIGAGRWRQSAMAGANLLVAQGYNKRRIEYG